MDFKNGVSQICISLQKAKLQLVFVRQSMHLNNEQHLKVYTYIPRWHFFSNIIRSLLM